MGTRVSHWSVAELHQVTTDSCRVSETELGPIRTSIPWREEKEEEVSEQRVSAERSSDRSKRKSISSFTSEEERAAWRRDLLRREKKGDID